jgi:hypothetical protein
VAEADGVEDHLGAAAGRRRQGLGVRRVDDVGGDLAQAHHLLHVDEGLADLAIVEAEHVQRHEGAGEQQDGGGEVADLHAALGDLDPGHDRQKAEAQVEHHGLGHVQQRERGVGPHRGADKVGHRPGVGADRAPLGPEGLDGLEVQHGIDRQAGRAVVGVVELTAVGQPPVGDAEGDRGIDADGHQGQDREAPVEAHGHDAHGHGQLDGGGAKIEDHRADQEIDRPRAPVDGAGERPALLALVEVEGERQRVAECLHRRPGESRLRDRGEDNVAGEGRGRGQQATDGKAEGQADEGAADALAGRQPVDRHAERDGRRDAGQLADEDEAERARQPQAKRSGAGAQDQPRQLAHRAPEVEARGRRVRRGQSPRGPFGSSGMHEGQGGSVSSRSRSTAGRRRASSSRP